MRRRAAIIILTTFLAMPLLPQGTPPEASENTGRPSGSSETRRDSALGAKVEEAWLLWKLGKKAEAREIVLPLLREGRDDPDLMQFGALMYLERGDLASARALVERLERRSGGDRRVRELKASLLLAEDRAAEASSILAGLTREYPDNWDYGRDYAVSLTRLKRWSEADDAFAALERDERRMKQVVWDRREAALEGAESVDCDFKYVHGPKSLRRYHVKGQVNAWPLSTLRCSIGGGEEFHKRKPADQTPGIYKVLTTNEARVAWFPASQVSYGARYQGVYYSGVDIHEFGMKAEVDRWYCHAAFECNLNHLVRDPVEGLDKQGRMDEVKASYDVTLLERLKVAYAFQAQDYRVDPAANTVNGQRRLGIKYFHDVAVDVVAFRTPYCGWEAHYRHNHWDKAFERAPDVLDFLADERIYEWGFFYEDRVGSFARIAGSIMRSFDRKRDVWATYSGCMLEIWPWKNVRALFTYNYDFGNSGVNGAGDSQYFTSSMRVMF